MDGKRRPGYLAKYAAHAGISRQAAAEKLSRVSINYLEPFDFDEADRRIQAAAHADRTAFSKQVYGDAVDDEPIDPETRKHPKFIESQACREMYRAKLTELEYLKQVGTLISAAEVDEEWFRIGRLVRDRLMNIPFRLAGPLAQETDQHKIHTLIEEEIIEALEAISDPKKSILEPSAEDGTEP